MNKVQSKPIIPEYDILSPDGFSIDPGTTYSDVFKAYAALEEWIKRYEKQGYYSSNNGRIELNRLFAACTLIDLNNKKRPK